MHLGVTGATTTAGLTNTGDVATDTLTTTGAATIGTALGVSGATTLGNTLSVAGAATFSSTVNVDSNGATAGGGQLSIGNTQASLQVANQTTGNFHGLTVGQTETTLSGGTTSTEMVLNDNGVTFRNMATGAPVVVSGVADGVNDFDAVNMRQLREFQSSSYAGIASAMAMASVPDVEDGKTFAIGVGTGRYMRAESIAVGANARINEAWRVRMALSKGDGTPSGASMGASFSW
ncbi:MAG: hypothetical protein K0Q68_1702 [Moraxellaceae bacterium]|nr:hypothetical protein [Moraxellaceae bacterium]